MEKEEALALARQLKTLPNVRVLGLKPLKDPARKALVVTAGRQRISIRVRKDLAELSAAAGLHGSRFTQLGWCSVCFGSLKVTSDGHFHEYTPRNKAGERIGAQAVCCDCLKASGGKCGMPKSDRRFESEERLDLDDLEQQVTQAKLQKAADRKARRERRKREQARLTDE